jgi:hypothetical protein
MHHRVDDCSEYTHFAEIGQEQLSRSGSSSRAMMEFKGGEGKEGERINEGGKNR